MLACRAVSYFPFPPVVNTVPGGVAFWANLHILVPTFIFSSFFFFNDTATTEIYTLSLHDALPICSIRILIEEVMQKSYGDNWWESIDLRVKRNVENNLEIGRAHV